MYVEIISAATEDQGCPIGFMPIHYITDDDVVVSESEASHDHAISKTDVDKLLSDKLNRLSFQERTLATHELHGVADDTHQEPATATMIRKKLQKVNQTLSSPPSGEDALPYQEALNQNKEYVKRITLMCLRADGYDSKKAAARVLAFFSFKRALFGAEKVAREIRQSDLEKPDVAALRDGIVQLLPERDQSGRAVIMVNTPCGHLHSIESWSRVFYYVVMAALQDEETQVKGMVCVLFQLGQRHFRSRRPAKFAAVWAFVPIKLVAMHVCCNTGVGHHYVKAISLTMESHHLCRFRRHFGSFLECRDNLVTFGIPKSILPFQMETCEVNHASLHSWINSMKSRESDSSNRRVTSCWHHQDSFTSSSSRRNNIMVPGPMDIVMGRGSHARNTMGHFRFRCLLEEHRSGYDSAERHWKAKVVRQVMAKLRSCNCRFLRPVRSGLSTGLLEECNDDEAKKKIAHAFRNMRQEAKAKDSKDNSTSSETNGHMKVETKKRRRPLESSPGRRNSFSPFPERQ